MTTDSGSTASKIKCVFLGDGAVGKTSLIVSYTTNGYPNEYIPTAIDTYDVVVHVDGEPVTFEMCDTPGQDDFDTLRPLVYPNTDVFLLCFSVVSPASFLNVREKWIPELKNSRDKGKSVPIILVGTQSDLRNDVNTRVELARFKEQPVSESEAKKLSNTLGCDTYIETSALTQHNLKEVFDEAIVAGLKGRKMKEKRAAKKATRQHQGCNCNIL
jgi:Ras family protein U